MSDKSAERAEDRQSGFSNYLDALFGLRCVPDLLAAGMFPNAKEWTECYGLFRQARTYLGVETFGRRDVLALDIGCGKKPSLGALIACMTRWSVIAVDPRLSCADGPHPKIHGLTTYARMVTDMEPIVYEGLVVSFHCHSHAPLADTLRKVNAPRHVLFALPCCKTLDLPQHDPVIEFEDEQILSPKRLVRVWDLAAAGGAKP